MIYLDNAATSFPKPDTVTREMYRCVREYCGNPQRGSHKLSLDAANAVYECRENAASLFSCEAENVVFTMNTTYALNMAIKTLCPKHGHILISSMEHNSVFRPVYELSKSRDISYSLFDAFSDNIITEIDSKVREDTRLIVCAHSSNICNRTLPIDKIGSYCRKKGIRFIVDGAQSAGHREVDIRNADVICVPGHKALYGIQGVGMMICRENFHGNTFIEGGSGINSLDPEMPEFLPERYEGGTLPTPSIVSLNEGIRFVQREGLRAISQHECYLFDELYARLVSDRRFHVISDEAGSVFLFNVKGKSPSEVGEALSHDNICVRSGYHCTKLCHGSLGTLSEGAVRVSFGIFNRKSDVLRLCDSLWKLVK